MAQLSERLSRLAPSETLAMSQMSNEMKAKGIDVINMSVGEPDFMTPEHIKEAGKEAIDNDFSKYSPVSGYAALREAIVKKLKTENGLEYSSSEIIVSTGAKQGICNAIMALVNPGDEVIIPSPYWVSYPQMVRLSGGEPVFIPTSMEQNFKITAEQLENTITAHTKLIILCSPSNPTGSIYNMEELEVLSKVILRHEDLFVLSDEIYEHINYVGDHVSIASFSKMKSRTILCNGVSKAYSMTGWRLGWVAAPEWIVSGLTTLQGQYTSGTSSVSQMAALAAYQGRQDEVETFRQRFQRRRDLIVRLINEINGFEVNIPDGAFYLFAKCSSLLGKYANGKQLQSSKDLAIYLLEEAHVATVAGDAFGAPNYIRFSYATSEENIQKAMERIKKAVEKLR